jgi:menaquinol-cytochrome c reductase cytochrome b/c subunit
MYKWIMAVLFFAGCIFGVGYMAFAPSDKAEEGEVQVVEKVAELVDASNPANANVYQKATCVMCHGTDLKGGAGGPTLLGVGDKHDKDEIMKIIKEGFGTMGAQYDANIGKGLTEKDLDDLATWLSTQKAK